MKLHALYANAVRFIADEVRRRGRPVFLLCSALDPVREIFVVSNRLTQEIVAELSQLADNLNVKVSQLVVPDGPEGDLWIQDAVEIGWRIATENGDFRCRPAVIAGLRSGHQGVNAGPLDEYARRYFAERGYEVIEVGTPRVTPDWIDWYGNLEVTPPIATDQFPCGRVMIGRQGEKTMHSAVLAFLEEHGVQMPPLVVDTSWLTIGHVDEILTFIPSARSRRGFKAVVPSCRKAITLLEELVREGHAGARVFEGTAHESTVAELLEEVRQSDETAEVEAAINELRSTLLRELSLTDDDIVSVPAIFRGGAALLPNSVNVLVCNDTVVAPAPRGPTVTDKDVFAEAIRQVFETEGLHVHFVDDWQSFHVRGGEVHCGTNTLRLPLGGVVCA